MIMEKRVNKLISRLGDSIIGRADVLGEAEPSVLFFSMMRRVKRLLCCEPDGTISKGSIRVRKVLHPILLRFLPLSMKYKQVVESKNSLRGIEELDIPQKLSKRSVIWCANHGFKDDVAATIRIARHSYILLGSLPAFINTFDGVGAYINGVVMCNRKVKKSKAAAQETCRDLLNSGMDVLMFPEGGYHVLLVLFVDGKVREDHSEGTSRRIRYGG